MFNVSAELRPASPEHTSSNQRSDRVRLRAGCVARVIACLFDMLAPRDPPAWHCPEPHLATGQGFEQGITIQNPPQTGHAGRRACAKGPVNQTSTPAADLGHCRAPNHQRWFKPATPTHRSQAPNAVVRSLAGSRIVQQLLHDKQVLQRIKILGSRKRTLDGDEIVESDHAGTHVTQLHLD